MELIDKADVVAEIKRIMDAENESINSFEHHRNTSEKQQYNVRMALLERILFLLNTIEVKEINLEQEIEKYLLANAKLLIESDSKLVVHHIAEHFFKLGIQQAQKGE